ncbi:MAG: DUF1538 domain-containing protein [Treponema sp.]
MNLLQKFKETLCSVLPIMVIVLLLGMTVAPLGKDLILRFIIGGVLLIFGLTIFLLGVDIGILPIGEQSGAALTSKKNLGLLLSVSFAIGFIVTIAEPDVQVLADQICSVSSGINKWILVCMIAVGIGLFVMIGLFRTVTSFPLNVLLIVSYIVVFILAFLCIPELQGVAFDAGGATTGPMTVPFIMALGVGVASVRKGSTVNGKTISNDDSFGLTGIASIGPIAAVCIYGIALRFSSFTEVASSAVETTAGAEKVVNDVTVFLDLIPQESKEVALALAPLIGLFVLLQIFLLKMPPVKVKHVIKGFIYSYIGLVLFLVGANGGFIPAGNALGEILGGYAMTKGVLWSVVLIAVSVVFGAVVVCAEPAVWVLTEQVESVSGGTIKRKVMLAALSAGVAISVGLSVIRIIFNFSLWYILIPGYAVALVLSLFCPKLFVGIAFDSGGVASGPMTSTFILSFTLGVSSAVGKASATNAFGVIALVAMTPLIAIQILGLLYKHKNNKAQKNKMLEEK